MLKHPKTKSYSNILGASTFKLLIDTFCTRRPSSYRFGLGVKMMFYNQGRQFAVHNLSTKTNKNSFKEVKNFSLYTNLSSNGGMMVSKPLLA